MLLLTGATGFVGRAVCQELTRRGVPFRIAARRPAPDLAHDDIVDIPDISGTTDWSRALGGVDVVIHVAGLAHVVGSHARERAGFQAVNVDGTMQLARAAAAVGVRRFVYLSSAKAAGDSSDTAPLRETDLAKPLGAYAISKWQAEEGLRRLSLETTLSWTIVRTPLVYGPGVRANFLALLRAVDREIPLPFGSVHNARSFIYVRNLADALVECAGHHGAHDRTFYVKDGPDPSTPELVRRIAAALHRRARLIPVPPAMLTVGASLLGKRDALERLVGSFVVDARQIRDSIGWAAPRTMDEGLADTAAWYVRNRTQ